MKNKRVFFILFYSLFSLSYIVADNVYVLTLIRLLHGIASAMVLPIAMAYIGDQIEDGQEGRLSPHCWVDW